MEGHDKPCYYCGEPCSAMHGNPGLWPLAFCHRDEPGFVKWHHTQCVTKHIEVLEVGMREMILAISGGQSCDPQRVADALRRIAAQHGVSVE